MLPEEVTESNLVTEPYLYRSVINDDEEAVKTLLSQGVDVHMKVKGPLTCIHIAVEKEYLKIIEHLLQKGADANSRYPVTENSYTGSTLLYRAAAKGNEAMVSLLIEYNADVEAENEDKSTALHIAAEKGYLQIVKILLQKGAKVNFKCEYCGKDFYREQFLESKILRNELDHNVVDVSNISRYEGVHSPLHLAIKARHENVVKLLLDTGADVDALDSYGDTALSLSVQKASLETLDQVLNRSPSLNNCGNKRALSYAVKVKSEKHQIMISKLLEFGFSFDPYLRRFDASLPETAMANGYIDVILSIIGKDENFDKSSANFLLKTAIEYGYEDIINFLLEQGVSVSGPVHISPATQEKLSTNLLKWLIENEPKAEEASKFLFTAVKKNMHESIEILLNKKVCVNTLIKDEYFLRKHCSCYLPFYKDKFPLSNCEISPLLVAAALGDQVSVKLFLEYGANINFKTDNNLTPLHISVIGGHFEVVEILLKCGANIEATDLNLRTPLYLAAEFGHEKVVRLLLRYGAKIDARAGNYLLNGLKPFHIAAEKGHLNVVKTLIKLDAHNYITKTTDNERKTALHYAAQNGHNSVVKFLLDLGAEVNIRNGEKETALFCAAANGKVETVKILLECGANVRIENLYSGNTPLYNAVKRDHEDVVKLLLKYGADPNEMVGDGLDAPLTISARNGNQKIVDMLIKFGADTEFYISSGETTLSLALREGHSEVVKLLLANGARFSSLLERNQSLLCCTKEGHFDSIEFLLKDSADINFSDHDGQTALHLAAACNHIDIVQLLLKSGSNIDFLDKKMRTPLFLAVEKGHLQIVETLLKSDANIEAADHLGRTALYVSAEIGHADVLNLLMRYGAEPNHNTLNSKTPLIVSAEKGHFEITKILVESGASVNSFDYDGQSAFYFAAEYGNVDAVKLLQKCGAEIDSSARNGKTPLIISSEMGHFEIVETLIKSGANVDSYDNNGQTALYFAAEYGHFDTVILLLERKAKVVTALENGKTPLIICSERGHMNCIDPLLKLNANVHSTDKRGLTAIHYAAEFGHSEIVKLLLEQCANINSESRDDISLLLICAEKGFYKIVDTLMKFGARFDLTDRSDLTDHLTTTFYKWTSQVFTFALEYSSADYKFSSKTNLRSLFDVVNKLADINGRRLTDDEESNYINLTEILVRFFIKMKSANLYTNEENLVATVYCDETEISSFENKCKAEIRAMFCEAVKESGILVYNILTFNLNRLAACARNDCFFPVLMSQDFESKFPLYCNIIRNQFNKGIIRRQLLNKCVEICLSSFFHFVRLPSNIIENILLYVNNRDLRSLSISNHHSCISTQQLLQQ